MLCGVVSCEVVLCSVVCCCVLLCFVVSFWRHVLDRFGYRFDDILKVFFVSIFGHVFDVLRVGGETTIGEGGVDPAYRGILHWNTHPGL